MIIDAHVHIGEDVVFDEVQTEAELLDFSTRYGVDGGIVQGYLCRPYLEDTRAIHDRIHRLTLTRDKRWWGMASINPHFRPDDYDAEAARCVRDLGFVGIKITPIGHACHPSSRDALHVFEVCRALGVPLMIHTGAGAPFSDPISCARALEAFPDVPVVLAHAGSEISNQQALYLAKKHDNVWLEPSWVGVIATTAMYRRLGAGRLLFSSDNLYQIPVELAKYRSIIASDADLERVLYRNVVELYGLKI